MLADYLQIAVSQLLLMPMPMLSAHWKARGLMRDAMWLRAIDVDVVCQQSVHECGIARAPDFLAEFVTGLGGIFDLLKQSRW